MTAFLEARRWPLTWFVAAVFLIGFSVAVVEKPAVAAAPAALLVLAGGVALALREPRWAVLALMFAAYSDLTDSIGDTTGLPSPFRAGIIAVVMLFALQRLQGGTAPRIQRMPVLLSAGFVGVAGLSILWASDAAAATASVTGLVPAAILAILIATTLRETPWLARGMWSIAAAGAGLSAVNLVQQITHTYDNTYFGLAIIKFDDGVARSGGPNDPNFFAQALVFSAALALYLTLAARTRTERACGAALTALSLTGVAITSSRGGALAVIVCLALVVVFRRPSRMLLIPAAALGAVVLLMSPPAALERFTTARSTSVDQAIAADSSTRGRFSENIAAAHMFSDHPLEGVGAGNYPVHYAEYAGVIGLDARPVRQPHNTYLQVLAELGAVGGVVLLVFLWTTVRGAWNARSTRDSRRALLAEGVLVGLVGILTTSIFLHAAYPNVTWTAFGLAWAAAAGLGEGDQEAEVRSAEEL